jgi:hypothetical protein
MYTLPATVLTHGVPLSTRLPVCHYKWSYLLIYYCYICMLISYIAAVLLLLLLLLLATTFAAATL